MTHAEAITEYSFNITGRGILLELRHTENRLPQDTELLSEERGIVWKVNARVLIGHAVHVQKIFKNESVEYMRMSFDTIERREKSIYEIQQRETQEIYTYFLTPIDHGEKPQEGEKLIIRLAEIQ